MSARASAALYLLLAACAHAPAPVPAKPWPAEGRCIAAQRTGQGPCIQVSLDETRTIQQLIASYPPAKDLAMRPITEYAIGAFLLYGATYPGFSGEVLIAVAVDHASDSAESGLRVFVGRDATGWHLLGANRFHETVPAAGTELSPSSPPAQRPGFARRACDRDRPNVVVILISDRDRQP